MEGKMRPICYIVIPTFRHIETFDTYPTLGSCWYAYNTRVQPQSLSFGQLDLKPRVHRSMVAVARTGHALVR